MMSKDREASGLCPVAKVLQGMMAFLFLYGGVVHGGEHDAATDWASEIIYFVLIDRFADGDTSNNQRVERDNPGGYHGGDLKGLTQHLDEIESLGATAIWINPIQEQVAEGFAAEGPPETNTGSFTHWGFHGYWMEDFNAIEPQFGSEADMKALVDAAHARGLKVLLDVVYNHAGYGADFETAEAYAGWVRQRQVDCGADALLCQVGGLPDFDTEKAEVQDYLFNANLGLARRTGIDGLRLDTVKHIGDPFWQQHRQRVNAELGEDFFLLGEVWGGDAQVLDPWFEQGSLDAGFDFSFSGNCRSFVSGRGRAISFAAYLRNRHKVRDGFHLSHYLSSHDETMAIHELGYDFEKFRMCVAIQMAVLGIPMIYYGEEVGRLGGLWPTNRADMPWGERNIQPGAGVKRDEDLRAFYQKVIAIRKQHRALTHGDYMIVSGRKDPLLAFSRTDAASGQTALVIANREDKPLGASLPAPAAWAGKQARDAISDTEARIRDGQISIEIPARSVMIVVSR